MPELLPFEPGTPDWHAVRKAGVTATDIVTILGLSHYDSVYSLFWRKLGQVPEVEDNDRLRLGRELQDYVIARWGEAHPDAAYSLQSSLWRSSARPWQMATLDAEVYDGEAKPTTWDVEIEPARIVGVLEVKTWADADRHSWDTAPPPQVRAQVLWQMDVMDVAVGHVGVVFLPSGEFRSYTIKHHGTISHHCHLCPDVPECADLTLMRAAGLKFMQRLRLELPAPDPDASAATLAAVKARFTRQPDKEAEVDGLAFDLWKDAKHAEKFWADEIRGLEIRLREQAGEASVYTVDGQPVARRVIVDAQVKAHTRHQDYLKRIKGDDSE